MNRPFGKRIQNIPMLARFRIAISEIYGNRVERIVFGSRARGDASPDSGYDIAVFLRDMPDRMAEINRLADLSTTILYKMSERIHKTGECIHAMPYYADAYNDERAPLMHEIRAEGIDL